MEARRLTDDIVTFSSFVPLPGLGVLPVNAYLIKAQEPVPRRTVASSYNEVMLAGVLLKSWS